MRTLYFALWFLLSSSSSIFFFFPRLISAVGSLEMQDPKYRQKFAIWAPSHNFVEPYLRK